MVQAAEGRKRRPKQANGNGGARYRADKGIWEWRHTTPDGRRFSGYAKTQVDAKARCMAKVRQAEKGIDVKATKQKVGDYLTWWLENIVTPKLAPKTIKSYSDIVRLHLTPDLGKHELGKLTPQHVQTLLRAKEKAGLSPRSVAMIREVLRRALNVAIKMQMIERNAAAQTEPPRLVKTDRRMFTPAEAKQLLSQVETDRLAALYRVALTLGMRQAEIIGLRWVDVDLEQGVLRVRQSLQRIGSEIHIKEPKTDRSRRTLALSSSLVRALTAHRDKQAFERRQAGKRWVDSSLVFTTTTGSPLDARNLTREFKRHLVAAGLPETTRFYDMRHAAASLLIADGVPLTAVSAMLGHALTSTTLNVYAHVLPGGERATADAMERLLG
ncbi:MAG: site-specific integrase [Thermomicrobiales bacterium]